MHRQLNYMLADTNNQSRIYSKIIFKYKYLIYQSDSDWVFSSNKWLTLPFLSCNSIVTENYLGSSPKVHDGTKKIVLGKISMCEGFGTTICNDTENCAGARIIDVLSKPKPCWSDICVRWNHVRQGVPVIDAIKKYTILDTWKKAD